MSVVNGDGEETYFPVCMLGLLQLGTWHRLWMAVGGREGAHSSCPRRDCFRDGKSLNLIWKTSFVRFLMVPNKDEKCQLSSILPMNRPLWWFQKEFIHEPYTVIFKERLITPYEYKRVISWDDIPPLLDSDEVGFPARTTFSRSSSMPFHILIEYALSPGD